MGNLANYTDNWTEDDVDREVKETAQEKADESDFLTLDPDTEVVLRVLPNPAGGSPFVKFAKHFFRDPGSGKMVSFACPAKSKLGDFTNYDCPICAQSANLRRSRIKADKDLGFQMRAKAKAMVNVLVRPSDDAVQAAEDDGLEPPKGKVKLWEISSWYGEKNGKNMHERLLALRTNRRIGGNFVDPTGQGFDLLLQREGKDLSTRYEVHPLKTERRPLLPDEAAAGDLIENGQIDITWYITPPTPDELQQILQGEKRGGGESKGRRALPRGRGRETVSPDAVLPAGETAGDQVSDDYGEGGATGAGF